MRRINTDSANTPITSSHAEEQRLLNRLQTVWSLHWGRGNVPAPAPAAAAQALKNVVWNSQPSTNLFRFKDLPFELLWQILILSAEDGVEQCKSLSLVSPQFMQIGDPILFRLRVFRRGSDPTLWMKYFHSRYLPQCTFLHTIILSDAQFHHHWNFEIPCLRRLRWYPTNPFHKVSNSMDRVLAPQVFATLMHLSVVFWSDACDASYFQWDKIVALENLTVLAIVASRPQMDMGKNITSVVKQSSAALIRSTSLDVILWIANGTELNSGGWKSLADGIQDPRLVLCLETPPQDSEDYYDAFLPISSQWYGNWLDTENSIYSDAHHLVSRRKGLVL
ncbi:hypothetical protein DL96DRAFT_1277133 [Flagelloscypha sp. PMI_526]|nr:hypothetical protein DL96DRAFT_1277133 [Flagelloscypha sp. PMI_526]